MGLSVCAPARAQFGDTPADSERIRRGALLAASVLRIEVKDSSDRRSLGTGFLISADGLVVTNAHVVAGAMSVTAYTQAGDELDVLGWVARDEAHDIAVLQLAGEGYRWLELGHSVSLRAGQDVWTMGHPTGLAFTLEQGHVSVIREDGLPEDIAGDDSTRQRLIQVSLPIAGGSSGSPVLDRTDSVIGVLSSSMMTANLSFAVPVEVVKELVDDRESEPQAFANSRVLWLKLGFSVLFFAGLAVLLRVLGRKDTYPKGR